uniref:Uncharacterized protein n=1 Tax=Anas zonorhyncha TaxID=75864 RepID=A0A8B9VST8_9AVES
AGPPTGPSLGGRTWPCSPLLSRCPAPRKWRSLGIICTTAAYPSWVVVRRGSLHSVLGIICVLNQIEPSSNCHFVGRAGLAFMSLTALCYLLALLSSCGAMLLDILGLKLSRMTAPFLHGLVVLFTAIAVVSSCGLWVLTRHNLRTAQHPQLLGHSVVFGPSFYFCLLALELFLRTFLWFLHMPRPFPGTDQEDATRLQVHGTFFPITLGMR